MISPDVLFGLITLLLLGAGFVALQEILIKLGFTKGQARWAVFACLVALFVIVSFFAYY